jgi:sec-independent protein translocase protein TatA
MFRNPTTDLIVVLVIVLLIFGPKRLPGLGKSLGSGLREFKDSIGGNSNDDEEAERPEIAQASAPPVAGSSGPVENRPAEPAPAQPARESVERSS